MNMPRIKILILFLYLISYSSILTSGKLLPDKKNFKYISSIKNNNFVTADLRIDESNKKSCLKSKVIKSGLVGAAAGSIQVITLMWLRTIVNYQYRYGISLTEAFQALYKEGGVPRFYQGVFFALLQNSLSKFGAMSSYEMSRSILSSIYPNSYNIVLNSFLSSFLNIIWKVILMPLETMKTVLQVNGEKGFIDLIRHISNGDLLILYKGTLASIVATFAAYYPWIFTYNWLNKKFSRKLTSPKTIILLRSSFIGFFSSLVSDVFSNFLRVIKTMIQVISIGENANISYFDVVGILLTKKLDFKELFFRGLLTKIFTNGLQSILFTLIWNYFAQN